VRSELRSAIERFIADRDKHEEPRARLSEHGRKAISSRWAKRE
jgi:hypothetical protein